MKLNFLFVVIVIVAMAIFAYMRNKQAQRNDERRER